MKKKGLILLISAASFVIVSLIGIQLYWITVSFETQQKKFDQSVMSSLSTVIKKLEKEEAITQVTSKLFKDIEIGGELQSDSVLNIEQFPLNDPFTNNSIKKESNKNELEGDQYRFNFTPSSDSDSSIFIIRKTQKRILGSTLINVVQSGDSLLKNQFQKKAVLLNDIVNELALISVSKSFNDRVEVEKIDSLLKLELSSFGINIPFKFDVLDAESNTLSFYEGSNEILNTPYKVSLFPNDYFIESNQLLIFFPDQSSYVLKNSWKVLFISVFLIVVLIAIFYNSISTILKQKKLSAVKNDFINNMTHELKTPISTISLACEALSDENLSLGKDRRQAYVKMIEEENTRLSLLVDNVLKSAVWDSSELELNLNHVSLNELIENIVTSFEIQIKNLGGNIIFKAGAKKDIALVDQIHFTNVIYNLLDNAKKYSNLPPIVNIETSNDSEGNIVIKIKDNGIGISSDEIKKVFEKFYRVPTGNIHDVKGFGLGLSYVKRILEMLNGSIRIESTVNEGSTVTLKLNKNE